MSADIDRLAKIAADALESGRGFSYRTDDTTFEWIDFDEFDTQPLVRAILQAMREPTLEMIEAGSDYHHPADHFATRKSFIAVIDYLLNE